MINFFNEVFDCLIFPTATMKHLIFIQPKKPSHMGLSEEHLLLEIDLICLISYPSREIIQDFHQKNHISLMRCPKSFLKSVNEASFGKLCRGYLYGNPYASSCHQISSNQSIWSGHADFWLQESLLFKMGIERKYGELKIGWSLKNILKENEMCSSRVLCSFIPLKYWSNFREI